MPSRRRRQDGGARRSSGPPRPARDAAVAISTVAGTSSPGEVHALHFERTPAGAAPAVICEEAAADGEVRREGRVAPVDDDAEAPTATFHPV